MTPHMDTHRHAAFNSGPIAIGLIALVAGLMFYLIERPPAQLYYFSEQLSLYRHMPKIFGTIGDQFPTFIHTFAFIALSAGVLSCRKTVHNFIICGAWFGVETLFEITQHDKVYPLVSGFIPDWFSSVPVLENTLSYFQSGTFDPLDIASIALGAGMGFFAMQYFTKASDANVKLAFLGARGRNPGIQ